MGWQVWPGTGGFRYEPSSSAPCVAEPGSFAPHETVLRFVAGGICGTDLGDLALSTEPGASGWPLHEVVGEVLQPGASTLSVGDVVVGWAADARGLRDRLTVLPNRVALLPSDLAADPLRAIIAQPLATVLSACDRIGEVRGARAVVLGAGSIGLLFVAELSRRGADVTAVDRIDRSSRASAYGAVDFIQADAGLLQDAPDGYDIVVEAIGHDTAVQAHAFELVAESGTLFLFGVPDDDELTIPFRAAFFRNVRMLAGITTRHAHYLAEAITRLTDAPRFAADYVTAVYGAADAGAAYREAARDDEDRVKVVVRP